MSRTDWILLATLSLLWGGSFLFVELALAGETPAERKLALFHGAWGGSVDPVFRSFAY